MPSRPSLSVGIEEEYLIVHRSTRDLVTKPDQGFQAALEAEIGDQVTGEFLQCQVEVGTRPHDSIPDAIAELRRLRDGVAQVCARFDYAPIAASTHPFSRWRDQARTEKDRYQEFENAMGQVVSRLLICGMHVHVGIEDPDLRIDLMNQVTYFLPHMLALSGSSPFWEGADTRLSSYRLTVFDAMPRTGLPDVMPSYREYERMLQVLVKSGCIKDATRIWWDIRPSDSYPTVEQRATDICSRLEDTAAIAALYQCLMAYLFRQKIRNQRWRQYPVTLITENRWRAQRFGTSGELLDLGRGALVPLASLIDELIEMLLPDAEVLDCRAELLHLRRIVETGNSAHRQRAVFQAALAKGQPDDAAMCAVVDHLIAEF